MRTFTHPWSVIRYPGALVDELLEEPELLDEPEPLG